MEQREKIPWFWITAVWLAAGFILTGLLYLDLWFPLNVERWHELPTSYVIYTQMARALLWIPLTPVVFELRRRIPVQGWWLPVGGALHTAFALVFLAWLLIVRVAVAVPFWTPDFNWADFSVPLVLESATVVTLKDFFIYWLLLGAGYTIDAVRRQHALELAQSRTQTHLLEAQYHALRQQMNPHFFHNTLNAVAELVRDGQNGEAVAALVKLGSLQRTLLLTGAARSQPLEAEIAFVEKYLSLERLRFGPRLRVRIEADEAARAAEVPNLLLQPLVENAVRHGLARRVEPGEITVRAALAGGRLRLEVWNDPPDPDGGAEPAESTGTGLNNLRQRLQALHGADFKLEFQPDRDGRACVTVELPATRPTLT
jgi:hypothetical protein